MGAPAPSKVTCRVAAVVVNHNAGDALATSVAGLRDNDVEDIVVVDNASSDASLVRLAGGDPRVRIIRSARNLGFGAGANLGASLTTAELLLVCNPDLEFPTGAVARLVGALDDHLDAAVAGPKLLEPDGTVYPSGRRFPRLTESIGHGFLGFVWKGNPWTRRYRRIGEDQEQARSADWVSGACLLLRRDAFDTVGGFDEGYFMYVEDVDLCWRLHRAGYDVRYEPTAQVFHEQGLSTSRRPYRMLFEHHRSLLRYASRSTTGPERLLLPLVALGIAVRFALATLEHLVVSGRGPS